MVKGGIGGEVQMRDASEVESAGYTCGWAGPFQGMTVAWLCATKVGVLQML